MPANPRSWTAVGIAVMASLLHPAHAANSQVATESITEEVVAVASRLPAPAYQIGRSVSVLDAEQIANLGHQYAADLFRYMPGLAVNRAGGYGGIAQLRIRGSEANHSVVLIDGVDVSAAGSGEFDFSSLLAADIERIEVLRGPSSGLYGSNAIGGVVNVLTRQPDAGFGLDAEVEVGANDTRQGAVSITGGSRMIRGRLSYITRESEFDISTNDDIMGGERDADRNDTVSGQLRLGGDGRFDMALYGRLTKKDTDADGFDFSGGPRQGLAVDDLSFSETDDRTVGITAGAHLADGRSHTQIGFAKTDTDLRGEGFGSESQRRQARMDTRWAWEQLGSVAQRTTLFAQYEEERFKNLFPFDPSQVPTLARDFVAYGAEHRLEFGEFLYLNGTVRRDDNGAFDDATTFSMDAVYRFAGGNSRLHGSFGKAVTNPTFFEQFGFVPGTFVGNPRLRPERAFGWDLGLEHRLRGGVLVLDLTYFDIKLEDEIQNLFPSVINADGESERRGMELSAMYQPSAQLSVAAAYTYTDADEPAGEEVRRPKHMASLGVTYAFMGDTGRFSVNAVYNGTMLDDDFRRFFVNGFTSERTELNSYLLVNMKASVQVSRRLELFLRVENVFDEHYQEVISYAAPGRAMFGGVRYRFAPRG